MSEDGSVVKIINNCCSTQHNLSCNTDSVSICGRDADDNSRNIRTDSTGQLNVTATDLDIRNLSCDRDRERETTIPVDVFLELAPDDDDTHFFIVQNQAVSPGATRFLPFIENNNLSTGYPLPAKRARLLLSNAVGARDIPVDVGFAAWK